MKTPHLLKTLTMRPVEETRIPMSHSSEHEEWKVHRGFCPPDKFGITSRCDPKLVRYKWSSLKFFGARLDDVDFQLAGHPSSVKPQADKTSP